MTYKIQIDDLVRDATPDETQMIDAIQAANVEKQQNRANAAATRASAHAKLALLGLTNAEINALVG